MAKFWERLRSSAPLKGWFLFLVVALAAAAGALLPSPRGCTEPYPSACPSPLADAERIAYDLQMRLLREAYPRPLEDDVILIGVTEETEARFHEPVALWHRHFAEVLHALAKARPRAVGVDFVLPERSFDAIVPGLDLAMTYFLTGNPQYHRRDVVSRWPSPIRSSQSGEQRLVGRQDLP